MAYIDSSSLGKGVNVTPQQDVSQELSKLQAEIEASRNGYDSLEQFLDSLKDQAADANLMEKTFTPTAGQGTIDVSDIGTIASKTNITSFLVDGVPQFSSYTLTNETTITMNDGFTFDGTEEVFLQWIQGRINILSSHGKGHYEGGYDELDVTKLKNYNEKVFTPLGDWETTSDWPDWVPASTKAALKDLRKWVDDRAINVRQPPYNAKCDAYLADGSLNPSPTDDTAAIRSAIAAAEAAGRKLIIPGVAVITDELEVKKPLVIEGSGSGSGYTSAGIAGYKQKSGLLVKGSGTKRVRTRRNHRASATDPQDAPLSVALNIQAEGVLLRDISIKLHFEVPAGVDPANDSPTNYGNAWDIGVFVGCRTHFKTENVHVMGYWREACFYYDVTHATNLPRFNDLSGVPYDNTFNVSGGDGCMMLKSMAWGGKWGIKIAGAIKNDGNSNYYDELLGAVVPDYRGSFGFSDFTTYSCSIYGTDHHTFYRRNKATGNYLTDSAGGAMMVDGYAANASGGVWGHRHYSSRFASFEPFRVKLDQAARVQFYGCHIEQRSGTRYNQDGTTVLFDNTDTYGFVTGTSKTDHVILIGSNTGVIDSAFMPSTVRIHNYFPAGTSTGSRTTDKLLADSFESLSGNLNLRTATDPVDPTNLYEVQFRNGSTTLAYIGKTSWRSNYPSATDLGSGGSNFNNVFIATGAITPSDAELKQQIGAIPDAVLDAWAEVNYVRFKYNNAVEEKGDAARWHTGLIAQEIETAFVNHGLNAFDYGLLCYDEWSDMYEEEEILDAATGEYVKTGNMVLVIPAGSRYSIRSSECMMLEAALMRREINALKTTP